MSEATPSLDDILVAVIGEHRSKVIDWLQDEPGSWGFLAGQGVLAYRRHLNRPLSETERRLVWHRLWGLLTLVKQGMSD